MVMEDGEMVLSAVGSTAETALKKSLNTMAEAADADASGGASVQDASRKVLREAENLALQSLNVSASTLKKASEWGRDKPKTNDMEEDIDL